MATDPVTPKRSSPTEPLLESRLPRAEASYQTLEKLLEEVGDDDDGDIFGNRVEWKFVLQPDVAAVLRAAVVDRLHLEEFIPGRRKTLMHSVYFDSDDFMLYRRAASTSSSVKFRLRTYTTYGDWTKMDPQGFFECKIGSQGKKYKLRAMMPVMRAGELLAPPKQSLAGTGRLSFVPEARFMWKARRVLNEYRMAARLSVAYVREAFVSNNGQLRVTFDEAYYAAAIERDGSTPLSTGGGLDAIIVEIKFVGAIPPWLAEVLEQNGLPLGGQTFSKFRHGVGLAYPEVAAAHAARKAEPHAP